MQLNLIEQDIKDKEDSLRRCKSNLLGCIMKTNSPETHNEIKLLSQEVFLLEDQLKMYRTIAGILKEEQGSHDEMLQKA
jgi:hypothetical protein